jgi:hypothetical protein
MTTSDVFHIAATILALVATVLVIYRLYADVRQEARDKLEHAARMTSYHEVDRHNAEIAQRFGAGTPGMGIFNTPN